MKHWIVLWPVLILLANAASAQDILWYSLPEGAQVHVLRGNSRWNLQQACTSLEQTYGEAALFAMNAGMFHADGTPVGLHVNRGEVTSPLNPSSDLPGNFYLQPNGVFGMDAAGIFHVVPTADAVQIDWFEATQSGPLLVVDGALNPIFTPGSSSAYIRNGVGLTADGQAWFALSLQPLNFHAFASAFLAKGCTDALYLDGAISQAWVAGQTSAPTSGSFGPVLLVSP